MFPRPIQKSSTAAQWLYAVALPVALILWLLVSRGFVIYLQNFNNYNQVYGSIGAVVILLMWLYFSAYAVLIGAAVDAALAECRARIAALSGPSRGAFRPDPFPTGDLTAGLWGGTA